MKNIHKLILSRINKLIGIKYDKFIIPEGHFCYTYDKKTTEYLIDEWDNGFYIKPCPYHTKINDNYYCCLYNSKITKDIKFKEKHKICNINIK